MTAIPAPDSSFLGRILLLQSALQAAPDEDRLLQMLTKGLSELPGVVDTVLCVTNPGCIPFMEPPVRPQPCPVREMGPDAPFASCPGGCEIETPESFLRFSLRTPRVQFGALFLRIGEGNAFTPYEPFVANSCNLAALHLENARHARALEKLNNDLDAQVRERTEALRKSSELLKTTEQIAGVGGWECEVAGRRMTWTDETYRIHGFEIGFPSAGSPEHFDLSLACYDPEDRSVIHAAFDRCLSEGQPYDLEFPFTSADGLRKWVQTTAKPVYEDGKVVKVIGHIVDITGRRLADQALRESEQRLKRLFDNTPNPIFITDEKGRYIDANPAALEFLECSRSELLGRDSRSFSPSESLQRGGQSASAITNTRETDFLVNGRIKTLLLNVAPQSIAGSPTQCAIGHDITERKRAAEERERLQAQLIQAQKMESVGRLAGGVAHDFNNMLGVILGNVELALEDVNPSQPLYAILMEIRKAAERSAEFTRQLLAFARKQTAAPRVLELNETVEGMLKMLRRLIGEDIDLVWMPGKNLGRVKVDPSQVDQILANLCVNARDSIRDTGGITIETENTVLGDEICVGIEGAVPGEYVALAVTDNGCGMDSETLSRIFEPFFTTKEIGRGTGLGLATVYGIVRQNGGFIDVKSAIGHGTTVKVFLPRHAGASTRALKERQGERAARGHETILLVEDEPAILKLTSSILLSLGYEVVAAASPGEAVAIATGCTGAIDLLITDVVMPAMNGRDLAAKLAAMYPGLRRLFMSGYTASVIAHHGVLDEGVHFIQKPFSVPDLAAKVREILDSK